MAISSDRKGGIYAGSLEGNLRQRILDHDSNVVFVAGDASDRHRGYVLFGREGGLMAQALDTETLRISGDAVPIAARLGTVQGVNLSYRRRTFSASDTGLLIYEFPRRWRRTFRRSGDGRARRWCIAHTGSQVVQVAVSSTTDRVRLGPPKRGHLVQDAARKARLDIPALTLRARRPSPMMDL